MVLRMKSAKCFYESLFPLSVVPFGWNGTQEFLWKYLFWSSRTVKLRVFSWVQKHKEFSHLFVSDLLRD